MAALATSSTTTAASSAGDKDDNDNLDAYRRKQYELLPKDSWRTELARYLSDPFLDVKKDMDAIAWWQAHAHAYPTLACIAVDMLAIPASSVGSEQLFSWAALVATNRCSCHGPEKFEWIKCLHYHWKRGMPDFIQANTEVIKELELDEFEFFLTSEVELYGGDDGDSAGDEGSSLFD